MSFAVSPKQYEGVQPINPPGVIRAARAPLATDLNHPFSSIWIDTVANAAYIYTKSAAGVANWAVIGSATNEVPMQYADITLTNAQIKAMRAAPVELVAAPAAGSTNVLMGAILKLNYGTNVFTESTDNMAIRYTNGSGVIVSQAIEAGGFIDATADTLTNALPKIDAIVTAAGSAAKSLVLHNTGDGEYGGNAAEDTTITMRVFYNVVVL